MSKIAIPLSLFTKLASIAVHADEMMSAKGHEFDRAALLSVLYDPEVTAAMKDPMYTPFLPLKR